MSLITGRVIGYKNAARIQMARDFIRNKAGDVADCMVPPELFDRTVNRLLSSFSGRLALGTFIMAVELLPFESHYEKRTDTRHSLNDLALLMANKFSQGDRVYDLEEMAKQIEDPSSVIGKIAVRNGVDVIRISSCRDGLSPNFNAILHFLANQGMRGTEQTVDFKASRFNRKGREHEFIPQAVAFSLQNRVLGISIK